MKRITKTTTRSRVTKSLPHWKRFVTGLYRASRIMHVVLVVPVIAAGAHVAPVQPVAQIESASEVDLDPLSFDQNSFAPVRFAKADFTPVLGKSVAEEQVRGRTVLERERPAVTTAAHTPEPSFEEKRALVQRAAAHYGIDWRYLEAVWQVETGKSWDREVTSYMGAQGPMQFMYGTWLAHAFVDGNGDGVIAITSAADALYAGAHLLANAGGDRGDWDAALFSYNHSRSYVNHVKSIAEKI